VDRYDEYDLAHLLEALPPAPAAWVEAAKELPRARSEIDDIVARAAHDAPYRRAVTRAMEKALGASSADADRAILEDLCSRLRDAEDPASNGG
jgi:hypothetical protein